MSEQKQPIDLTSPEAVAIGQQVYDQLAPGQDVTAELDAAYGREERG